MTTVHENALIILRVMNELSTTLEKPISISNLRLLTYLDKSVFDQADTFLLQTKYVDGTMGDDGDRWITSSGVQYLKDEMEKRFPLNLDAERVLRSFVLSNAAKWKGVQRSKIESDLGLEPSRFTAACEILDDFDLIEPFAESGEQYGFMKATQKGRQLVHNNFKIAQVPSTRIQTGAIFQAPVTGGNIQAFASAVHSQIEQNVTEADPTTLRQNIIETLNNLLNEVNDALDLEQKTAYMQAVSELKQEIEKPKPNPGSIHKLITILSFGDNLNGTLELGEKSLELAVKAGPYVLLLYQFIDQLIKPLLS